MQTVSLFDLSFAFVPVAIVVAVLYWWSLDGGNAVYALIRMLVQLLLIGYVLTYIFEAENALIVVGVLCVMLLVSSWISLRSLRKRTRVAYARILGSISLGGVFTLALISQAVLDLNPWFQPQYVVPLAGMIFANSMNTVALAAERFDSEMDQHGYVESRRIALRACMIPVINSLFAVGLVSLPGMMTGQILSGVSPLIAAKYQIVVMLMLFGVSGVSAAMFLQLERRQLQ